MLLHSGMAAMSDVRVLDNSTLRDLLLNQSKEETIGFRNIAEKTFEDFSTSGERQYQPGPSVIRPSKWAKYILQTRHIRLRHWSQDHG